MTAKRLREWRGAKSVAGPAGTAIATRLRTTRGDDAVLDAVAAHLGHLRRADLAAVSRPELASPGLDAAGQRQADRDALNSRKRALTAQSSSRWGHAVVSANDAQCRSARDARGRHIAGLRASIEAIGKRLAQPTADVLTPGERAARKKARMSRGYATQAERYQKQRRFLFFTAHFARAEAEHASGRVRVTEGGRRLAKARHNLKAAELTEPQWRKEWEAARWRIKAIGSGAETFGNLTITVTPDGAVSLRLPKPLEHLANAGPGRANHGRYVLSGTARFAYRADEWLGRITGGKPVSYELSRKPGRAGAYLTAAWANDPERPGASAQASGPVVGVDLNDGHLAVRRLDACGNPVGRSERIEFQLAGTAARRDAQVGHAITRLLRYAKRHWITAIAVEELDFADARTIGRETMGRGRRGKRFRRTVGCIPTSVFRNRLAAQTHKQGIGLWAVNPAYSSVWGDQHWRKPYKDVTRHEAAATVIGRRAQGHKARRREGVTRARPEDHAVRATNQAGPTDPAASTGSRHRPGTRGSESRPPGWARTRKPGRATVTPASPTANHGQTKQ